MAVRGDQPAGRRRGSAYDFNNLLTNDIFDDARGLDRGFSSLAGDIHHLVVEIVSDGVPRVWLDPVVVFAPAIGSHWGADGGDGNAMGELEGPTKMAERDSVDAQLWLEEALDVFSLPAHVHADCLVKGLLEHGGRVGLQGSER